MSSIKLTTPDGYFERSLEQTMARVEKIRKRKTAALWGCGMLALLLGTYFFLNTAGKHEYEKEYLEQQAEMARLDIFLEVNQ